MLDQVDLTDVIRCHYCGAMPGQPCQTPSGRKARTHAPRICLVNFEKIAPVRLDFDTLRPVSPNDSSGAP